MIFWRRSSVDSLYAQLSIVGATRGRRTDENGWLSLLMPEAKKICTPFERPHKKSLREPTVGEALAEVPPLLRLAPRFATMLTVSTRSALALLLAATAVEGFSPSSME